MGLEDGNGEIRRMELEEGNKGCEWGMGKRSLDGEQ